MSENIVPFEEVQGMLLTGDILLFQGLGWESDIIQLVEMSRWSHVGMVVRVTEVEYPLIWESFPFKFVEDVVLHRKKSGARLVSLEERLTVGVEKELFERVAVRRLRVARSPAMLEALKEFISGKFHNLPYPGDWELLLEFVRGRLLREERGRTEDVHCAELIAETYKRMGLLPPEEPSNRFIPKDFSSEGELPLLDGAELEEELFLDLEEEAAG